MSYPMRSRRKKKGKIEIRDLLSHRIPRCCSQRQVRMLFSWSHLQLQLHLDYSPKAKALLLGLGKGGWILLSPVWTHLFARVHELAKRKSSLCSHGLSVTLKRPVCSAMTGGSVETIFNIRDYVSEHVQSARSLSGPSPTYDCVGHFRPRLGLPVQLTGLRGDKHPAVPG